jgi:uncharacterized protein (DUF58 family)
MKPHPSRRFLVIMGGVAVGSLALLVFASWWPALLAANLAVLLAAAVDLAVTPRAKVLRLTRLMPDRMSVLQEQAVTVTVENTSRVPLSVRVLDAVPVGFGESGELTGVVPANNRTKWSYTVTPKSRGRFEWGGLFVRYRSVLGFWDIDARDDSPAAVRVYPSLALLEKYHLLARSNKLSALGIRRVRLRGASTEFESLRDYASGDDVRQLDWKATARRARLIVRNQEAERNQTVLLLLDTGRLMNATENGVSKLDHAVNAALLLAHVALARGDRVGLCTFSGKVGTWLTPRGNVAQNRLISEELYDLKGDFTESDHAKCLKFVAARYPKRSLIVLLTDFVDGTTAAEMVAHLQLAARRHVVLFTALKDAFLDRAAAAAPKTDREGFRVAAAVDLLRERREVLEKIRHAGGFVIDAEPGLITPPMMNTYLEVMFGGLL